MADSMHTEVWKSLGRQDPDWAVESREVRRHGGWIDNLDAFYESGRVRVEESLSRVPSGRRDSVLDFGAGTGRLSFWLANEFQRVTSLDISEAMLATLRERAALRDIDNVTTVLAEEFTPSADHDVAITLITLQHFPNRAAVASALHTMAQAVKPGGYVYAELPLRPHNLKARIQPRLQAYRILRRLGASPTWLHDHGLSGISMLCAPESWVRETLAAGGADVLAVYQHVGTTHQAAFYLAVRR